MPIVAKTAREVRATIHSLAAEDELSFKMLAGDLQDVMNRRPAKPAVQALAIAQLVAGYWDALQPEWRNDFELLIDAEIGAKAEAHRKNPGGLWRG